MNYIQYTFVVTPIQPGSEILIEMISDFGFESFEDTDSGFNAYIPQNENHKVVLNDFSFEDFTFSFSQKKMAKKNWNKEWENNFDPVIIDETCCIRAPFHHLTKKYEFDIQIMPKMSFGTGHHDTTFLVCKNILSSDFNNKNVLDMGCGTGILSILAEKCGAKKITGIDIDDWSIENAIENCESNNCSNITILKTHEGLFGGKNNYDIILANINKNVLKLYLPVYSKLIKTGGQLFLSGFFKTDCDELIKLSAQNNFTLSKQEIKNDWAVLVLVKN